MLIRHCWPSDQANQLQLTPFNAFQTAQCWSERSALTALVSVCCFSVLREAERTKWVCEGLSLASLKVSGKITITSAYFILFVASGKGSQRATLSVDQNRVLFKLKTVRYLDMDSQNVLWKKKSNSPSLAQRSQTAVVCQCPVTPQNSSGWIQLWRLATKSVLMQKQYGLAKPTECQYFHFSVYFDDVNIEW